MFSRSAPAGYLNVNGDMVFTKMGSRIRIAAFGSRVEQRTIFTAPPGQNTVFGAMPGPSGSQAVIQVYSRNIDPMPSTGFRYGDIRCGDALGQVRITSAALGPNSDGTGAPSVLPLCFFVNGISHLVNIDGSWSFCNGVATMDSAGKFTMVALGIGVAPNATGINIGGGGAIQFNRPDGADQFSNSYVANDLLLTWNFNAGSTLMSLDNSGNTIQTGHSQATSIGLGVAPAAAVHIGVGGALRFDNSGASHYFTNYYNASLDRLDWAFDGGSAVFTVDSTGAVIIGATLLVGGVLTAVSTISVGGTTISGSGNNGVMQRIGHVVCSGSQATVVFSSIPAGYSNLLILAQGRDTKTSVGSQVFYMYYNADQTAAHYLASQRDYGTGGTASADQTVASTTNGGFIGWFPGTLNQANAVGTMAVTVYNYTGTTFPKIATCVATQLAGATPTLTVSDVQHVWTTVNAAIATITFTAGGTAFLNGTTFTLYGMP